MVDGGHLAVSGVLEAHLNSRRTGVKSVVDPEYLTCKMTATGRRATFR